MSFDGRELRNALGRFATGVCLITTVTEDGEPLALTMRDSTIRGLKRKESQLKRESTFASRESTRL